MPDEEVEVGQFFTPIYYEGVSPSNEYHTDMDAQIEAPSFEIGAPYLILSEYDELVDWYNAIFTFADDDHDYCVTKDEMVGIMAVLYDWTNDSSIFSTMAENTFNFADTDGSGVLSWAEFNAVLPTVPEQLVSQEEQDAMLAFFKYFDNQHGDQDYKLTLEEMNEGIAALAAQIGGFYEEYNFWWDYFNMDNDECVTLEELQTQLRNYYQVTDEDILIYWREHYWILYQVPEDLFYWYYVGNGDFDWDGYRRHIPDGPALDGDEYLLYNDEIEGAASVAVMWYLENQCYFSLDEQEITDPLTSGTCTIEGHPTIGDQDSAVTEIIFYFNFAPEEAIKLGRDTSKSDAWGPIAEQTEDRYYFSGSIEAWLWRKPDSYCDLCDDIVTDAVATENVVSGDVATDAVVDETEVGSDEQVVVEMPEKV